MLHSFSHFHNATRYNVNINLYVKMVLKICDVKHAFDYGKNSLAKKVLYNVEGCKSALNVNHCLFFYVQPESHQNLVKR